MKVIWAQNFASMYDGGIFLAGPTLRSSVRPCQMCSGRGLIDPPLPERIEPGMYYSLKPRVSCRACNGRGGRNVRSWRLRAIQDLSKLGYQGELFVPEPEGCGSFSSSELDHSKQILWERTFLRTATVIAFWIPRDLEILPGFTTNIEFGEWIGSGKCVLGFPSSAQKMGYIEYVAKKQHVEVHRTLKSTMLAAKEKYETDHHRT